MMTLLACFAVLAVCSMMGNLEAIRKNAVPALVKPRDDSYCPTAAQRAEDACGERARAKQRKDEAQWRREDIAAGRISRYNKARRPHIAWIYAGGPKAGYNISPTNTKTLCNAQIIPVIAASVSQRLAA